MLLLIDDKIIIAKDPSGILARRAQDKDKWSSRGKDKVSDEVSEEEEEEEAGDEEDLEDLVFTEEISNAVSSAAAFTSPTDLTDLLSQLHRQDANVRAENTLPPITTFPSTTQNLPRATTTAVTSKRPPASTITLNPTSVNVHPADISANTVTESQLTFKERGLALAALLRAFQSIYDGVPLSYPVKPVTHPLLAVFAKMDARVALEAIVLERDLSTNHPLLHNYLAAYHIFAFELRTNPTLRQHVLARGDTFTQLGLLTSDEMRAMAHSAGISTGTTGNLPSIDTPPLDPSISRRISIPPNDATFAISSNKTFESGIRAEDERDSLIEASRIIGDYSHLKSDEGDRRLRVDDCIAFASRLDQLSKDLHNHIIVTAQSHILGPEMMVTREEVSADKVGGVGDRFWRSYKEDHNGKIRTLVALTFDETARHFYTTMIALHPTGNVLHLIYDSLHPHSISQTRQLDNIKIVKQLWNDAPLDQARGGIAQNLPRQQDGWACGWWSLLFGLLLVLGLDPEILPTLSEDQYETFLTSVRSAFATWIESSPDQNELWSPEERLQLFAELFDSVVQASTGKAVHESPSFLNLRSTRVRHINSSFDLHLLTV